MKKTLTVSAMLAFVMILTSTLAFARDVQFLLVSDCEDGLMQTNGLAAAFSERLQAPVSFPVSDTITSAPDLISAANTYVLALSCSQLDSGKAAEVDVAKKRATVSCHVLMKRVGQKDLHSPEARALLLCIGTGAAARSLGMDYCTYPLCALSSKIDVSAVSSTLCPPCHVRLSRKLSVLNASGAEIQ
ncbi:MAG: hypothetical protein ACI9OU_001202 [Candidatus Promineifilaceae bacterium]|jgi:hypothetical protein